MGRLKLLRTTFETFVMHLCRQSYDGLKSKKHEQRDRFLCLPVTATCAFNVHMLSFL